MEHAIPAGRVAWLHVARGAITIDGEQLHAGDGVAIEAVMARLEQLDQSSLVVAGGRKRVRVHVHVNNPSEVFLACEDFGDIKQQKADDMERQRGLMDHAGEVAVVVDSAADIPLAEVERLGIHMVPVRLSFGAREYQDGISMTAEEFYERLAEAEAKATQMVSKAIAEGDINAINYFVATKYVEALQKIATSSNEKLVFMPLEASGVIGAIGGIAELAKSAADKQRAS